MPNALILTAPSAMSAPLPGTPKLHVSGDLITLTSDGFSGSGDLNGRTSDAALGGVPMAWQSSSGNAIMKVSGGNALMDSTSGTFFYHMLAPGGVSRQVGVGITVRTMPTGPGLYVDLYRSAVDSATSTKLRLNILVGAGNVSYNTGAGNTLIPGTNFTFAAGDAVQFSYNTKSKQLQIQVNGAVVVSTNYTPPNALTGQLFGLAGGFGVIGTVDNFTLTETIL